jgi:C4-dicarboxylate transporter DctQ subunit
LTFFSNFTIMVFSLLMIYYGWLMAVLQVRTNQKTIILQIPLVYLYAILPLMGTMMLIRVIQVTYQDILELRAKKSHP